MKRPRLSRSIAPLALCALLLCLLPVPARAQLGTVGGPGIIVFGRAYLPNGKPAPRIKIYLEMATGLTRDTICDEDGNYEFRNVPTGRYHVKGVNPNDAEQYSDPADSDSTRAYANRVQINVYLRLPAHKKVDAGKGPIISLSDAAIPKSARQAYEQGLKAQQENKPDKALAQFDQAIAQYPDYFQALTERANLRMQQSKLPQAEADFVRALRINEKYAPALRGLGYCQIQQKKFAEALANLENAYVLEPGAPMTLLLLGYANLSLDRYEEARQSLQQALKIGADSVPRAHVALAEVWAHDGKFKEAADELRAYLAAKPDAPDAASLRKLEADWRAKAR